MNYAAELLGGSGRAGIWGAGYIGYTTMLHLADCGIHCTAYDPDDRKVVLVNQGEHPVPGLAGWLTIEPGPHVAAGRLKATTEVGELLAPDVLVHIVAIPTEKGGQPWWEPLHDVVSRLAEFIAGSRNDAARPPLIIVESTLTPGTVDKRILPVFAEWRLEVGRDLLLGVAPRRDWFVAPDKTLATLDRVYCGVTEESAQATEEVLGLLCTRLHRASNYRVGEMVKCTENAFRHLEIALANQLAIAYPDVDIAEVLDLASTKWNMGSYRPSFGTGGYCIPLAGQYVIEGAKHPESLSLLAAAYESDLQMRWHVAKAVTHRDRQRAGILGLSYRGDLKVAVMSPSILIAKHLRDAGVEVKVHDPYYSDTEVFDLTGSPTFELPGDIGLFDTLIVSTNHSDYLRKEVRDAVLARAKDLLIIDNFGTWSDWPWPPGAQYYRSGSPGWIAQGEFEEPLPIAPDGRGWHGSALRVPMPIDLGS